MRLLRHTVEYSKARRKRRRTVTGVAVIGSWKGAGEATAGEATAMAAAAGGLHSAACLSPLFAPSTDACQVFAETRGYLQVK